MTLGYAALLYSFGALIVPVTGDTGWGKAHVAFGLTLALLVAAAISPLSGRLVDRGLGVELMVGGAGLGGAALLVIASAGSLTHWYLGWALVGPAMAASLYDTCFSFLARRLGAAAARPAIVRVTLVAGLASTLAFPLGAALAQEFGWRGAFRGFALLELALAAPAMAWAGARLRRRERAAGGPRPPDPPGLLRAALRTRRFWLMAGAFATAWLNHTMLVTFFIPLFTGLGTGPAVAVAAASTVGPFQVMGRLVLMALGQRAPPLLSTRITFALMCLAALVLAAAGLALPLVFAFAALQGAAIGMMSILRPVLTLDQIGLGGFGAVSGALSIAPLLATAAAPLLGAALLGGGGPQALILGALAISGVGLVLTLLLRPRPA